LFFPSGFVRPATRPVRGNGLPLVGWDQPPQRRDLLRRFPRGQLTLLNGLTGQESDGHNWNNLLGAPAATGSPSSRVAAGHLPNALSVPLSIDSDIIRHPEAELRQITLSVNDLTVSCRTSYSPSVA
jgi:hypothetical protein